MASLKFIAVSGTTGVTENFYIYEYETDLIVIDCGVGFPDPDMYGVDLVIPDFTYIKENKERLRAIFITHGHEDHIGALPFLLQEVDAPIYATKLVAGFIDEKFSDYKKKAPLNVFDPDKDVIEVGKFTVTPFRISHSVPDSVGYAIDSPEGRVMHVADYKFDWTPVDTRPFDVAKAAQLASKGVLALASDAIGSTNPGYTESERSIEQRIEEIAEEARGAIFFTTISSNISRIQQAINVAIKMKRKFAFVGRSIESKATIAKELGYLHYPEKMLLKAKKAANLRPSDVVFIISGSYGQPGSALYRVATKEHDYLSAEEGDVIIFSSDPAPPGSKDNVDALVDRFIERNIDVHYYDMQEDLHVSGHGSQEDIKMLFGLIKPKYFIPIGGTVRHNRAYAKIAQQMGSKKDNVFELTPGEIVEYTNGNGRVTGKVPSHPVLVDGLGVGDVGTVVLRDREVLSTDGIVIAILQLDSSNKEISSIPEVVSRGFVFEKKHGEILERASQGLLGDLKKKDRIDRQTAKTATVNYLERFFYDETGRRPMILPVVVEV